MSDLRERVPAQSLMQRTLQLHKPSFYKPSGDALSWYKGALGEIAVAGVLAWLPKNWTVLHSVPVGSGDTDIDHVVIGPAGVFTINTKSHPGQKIWVGGHALVVSGRKTGYVGLAAAEAARAARMLSDASGLDVSVTPMIVLVNPDELTVRAEPEFGVRVLSDDQLIPALLGPPVLNEAQVAQIVAAAVRPETWHRAPAPEVDTRALSISFNAIVAQEMQGAVAEPEVARARAEYAPRDTRTIRPSASARRRPKRRSTSAGAFAKLVSIGLGLWIYFAVVTPALARATGH